jgi:hypothetical protein
MSSSTVQKIADIAREIESRKLQQGQAPSDPRIDALASEAEGAKEIAQFAGFGVRLSVPAFIDALCARFTESCKKNAPEGVSVTVPTADRLRASLEKPVTDAFANNGFIPLAAMTFVDGSGALGMHFTDAPVALQAIRSIPSLIVQASAEQMDADGGLDLGAEDLDLEAAMDQFSTLKKKRDPKVLQYYMFCAQEALGETFSASMKAFTFESGMASFAISEINESLGALLDTFVDDKGQAIDPTQIATAAGKAPVPPSEEPEATATDAAADPNAAPADPNAAAPKAPQKNYQSFGQVIKAGDATALSRLIKMTRDEGLWDDSKIEQAHTLLYHAAMLGHVGIARVLMDEAGAKMGKVRDQDGRTDFLIAAFADKPEMVEFLHSRGAKLNESSGNGQDALMLAAENGAIDAARKIIELNETALRAMARAMSEDGSAPEAIAKELRKNDVLNETDMNGRNAMHFACMTDRKPGKDADEQSTKALAIATFLIEKNVNPTLETLAETLLPSELIAEEGADADKLYDLVEDARANYQPTDPLSYLDEPGSTATKKSGWAAKLFSR